MMNTSKRPVTHKVRRDVTGGRRGTGNQHKRQIRRPNPQELSLKGGAKSLSAMAGLIPFGKFLKHIGLDENLRRLFHDMKDPIRTTYQMEDQLRMLIDMLVSGHQRVFDLEGVARDPLFVRLAGGELPSIDVVYEDLKRFDSTRVEQLGQLVSEHGLSLVTKLEGMSMLHVDIDSTVAVVFGQLDGASIGYNHKYRGRPSYHPLLARCAESCTWIGAQFRPGNTSFGENDAAFVESCVKKCRSAIGRNTVLYTRIDAAGDCTAIMRAVHNQKAYFVTKGKMCNKLKCTALLHKQWETVDWDAYGKPTRQVAVLNVRREVWGSCDDLPIRVIALRTRLDDESPQLSLWDFDGWTYQVYLTNELYEHPECVIRRYNGRAGIEPQIAEIKNCLGAEAFSSRDYYANAALFQLKLLVHNLLRRYVAEKVPMVRGWRTDWIRRAVIMVPGKIVCSGRATFVRVPDVPALSHMLN